MHLNQVDYQGYMKNSSLLTGQLAAGRSENVWSLQASEEGPGREEREAVRG